jgi:hypothetical protein
MFAPKQKHFDGTDYSQHPSVKDVFKREPLDPLTALADRLKKAIKEWHFPMDLSDELNAIATALRQHAERGGSDEYIAGAYARLFPTWTYAGSEQAIQVMEREIVRLRSRIDGEVPGDG